VSSATIQYDAVSIRRNFAKNEITRFTIEAINIPDGSPKSAEELAWEFADDLIFHMSESDIVTLRQRYESDRAGQEFAGDVLARAGIEHSEAQIYISDATIMEED
jgi:hypothetical protein